MVTRVKVVPVGHKAVECEFCGHFYIIPCDEKRQETCQNTKLEDKQ